MKRIVIFVFLAMICLLLFMVFQVGAEEEVEYTISFVFQADDEICIIHLKDPLGESEHVEKLNVAPILINNELFLPIRDFTNLMGGTTYWDAKEKTVTLFFQDGIMRFELSCKNNQDIVVKNGKIMISLRYIIQQFSPCDVKWNDVFKIAILTWPLGL